MTQKSPTIIPVVPGIVPAMPTEIQDIFIKRGAKITVSKGYTGHTENAEPDPVIMVNRGYFYHGVTNNLLSKDIAISLLPPGTMVGFVNFFSRERMPSRSGALEQCEIYTLPHSVLHGILTNDLNLHGIYSAYQERCNKSDMYSMLWIMTHPIEERIKMLFAATLMWFGYNFDKNSLHDWIRMPLNFTRPTIAKVAYSSTLSITRCLAKWTEEGVLKREQGRLHVKPVKLLSPYEWIMERNK